MNLIRKVGQPRSIAENLRRTVGDVVRRLAAMKHCHLVAVGLQPPHQVRSHEPRAAYNKNIQLRCPFGFLNIKLGFRTQRASESADEPEQYERCDVVYVYAIPAHVCSIATRTLTLTIVRKDSPRMIRRITTTILMVVAGALFLTPVAHADNTRFGVRAGFGLEPDQFVIGGQAVFGRYLKIFRFAPSVDLGFGDDMTTYNVNGDFRVSLSPPGSTTALYVAGGPTISHFEFDNGNDTEVGLSLVGGVNFPMSGSGSYNAEFRYGVGDIPEVRFLFGISFGGGAGKEPGDKPDVIIRED